MLFIVHKLEWLCAWLEAQAVGARLPWKFRFQQHKYDMLSVHSKKNTWIHCLV